MFYLDLFKFESLILIRAEKLGNQVFILGLETDAEFRMVGCDAEFGR